jgi:chromosome segregation protein
MRRWPTWYRGTTGSAAPAYPAGSIEPPGAQPPSPRAETALARQAAQCRAALDAERARRADRDAAIAELRARVAQIEENLLLEHEPPAEPPEVERTGTAGQRAEIEALQGRLAEMAAAKQDLAEREQSLRLENASLAETLQVERAAMAEQRGEMDRLTARLTELEAMEQTLGEQRQDRETALADVRRRNAALEQALKQTRETAATLRKRLTNLDRTLRQENAELNLALEDAYASLEEKDRQLDTLTARLEVIHDLEAALAEAKNRNAALEQTLSQTRETAATLRKRLTSLDRTLRQENAELNLALQEARVRLNDQNARIAELDATRRNLAEMEQSLRLENASLSETLQVERAAMARQRKDMTLLQKQTEEREDIAQRLRQENARLSETLEIERAAMARQRKEMAILQGQAAELQSTRAALTKAQALNATLAASIDELESKVEDTATLNRALSEESERVKRLESELQDLRTEN